MKKLEIDGKTYNLRPWTVADWRRIQGLCKDKDLVEQWIIIAVETVVNDVGERYLADKRQHVEETFPLTTLQGIYDAALEYNLPFFKSTPEKHSPKDQN